MIEHADRTPEWLQRATAAVEGEERLDRAVATIRLASNRLVDGPLAPVLRGDWLGHALHPMLTDIPIGCWTSSFALDVVGGRRSRPASQRLIGLGLLAVLPTAAAGAVDWHDTDGVDRRRVGVAHAASNSVAALLYFASWRARRNDRHLKGVMLGVAAGLAATVGGHLGGHLAFGGPAGPGRRDITDITDIELVPFA